MNRRPGPEGTRPTASAARGTLDPRLATVHEDCKSPVCPWDCLSHHRGLFDRHGHPRASWCELCDRLVSNAEWLTTPAPTRQP